MSTGSPDRQDSAPSTTGGVADARPAERAPPLSPPRPALKDRIAELRLGARAGAVGERLAGGVKAVQSAAEAVRAGAINRDSIRAGRDGLAAKVEQFLKPRPADESPPAPVTTAAPAAQQVADVSLDEQKTDSKVDISALKARLDGALKEKTAQPQSAVPVQGDADGAALPPLPGAPFDTPITVRRQLRAAPVANDFSSRLRSGLTRIVSRRTGAPSDSAITELPPPPPPVQVEHDEVATQRTARTAQSIARDNARRPIFSLGLFLTAITAGGVLHILTTFAVPAINTGSAFDQLRWQLEPNVMRVFQTDANGQSPLPFLTADMRYAMCRYDISTASVQVNAILPDIGWSLALYTPQGDNFYAVPGLDGRVVTSAFTINPAGDRLLLPVPGVRRSDTDATQVTSPQRQGLVVIRAPNLGPAYQAGVEDALKRATCRLVPRR